MTSIVDKYYRRIIQNIDNIRMKFDISALLVKSKEHDSKIETNKNNIAENLALINSKSETNKNNIAENLTLINSKFETNKNNISENLALINSKSETNKNNIAKNLTLINSKFETNKNNISENLTLINSKSDIIEDNKNNIAENLTLINSKSDIIETNKNNISENLTLINSNENRLDNIENDIVNINTKVTNNYNITQINKKNIDFKTGIIDNHITAINSTLNNLKTKYSIENFFIYNIEIENTYTLNSDNVQFSIFNYDLEDDFKKDSILQINARLLYDYNSYNNIGKLIHNYKLYEAENVLFHEFKSLKSNAGDNLRDDLSQIDLFYVKLNKDYDRIKIELILSMIEGITGSVTCKLYNTFNSNFLCVKYIKKN